MKKSILFFLVICATWAYGNTPLRAETLPIGSGVLHVLGIDVAADPGEQTVPTNTGTGVKTDIVFPETDPVLTPDQVPALPSDYIIAAELSGPGITTRTITAKPGEMLMVPPLPQKGTYLLDRIRLMRGGNIVLYAEPASALINTIDKLLITQVTSRVLSIDEIEDLGIKINPNNYSVYNFTVGFATESGTVQMELPVVIGEGPQREEDSGSDFSTGSAAPSPPQLQVPNLHVSGFDMKVPYEEEVPEDEQPQIPPIAGAIIIPGNIAFLNQFFEVMLLVTNNAPDGTPLVVSDISAEIFLPAGDDNTPGSMDDPLRIAVTDQGAQFVVPVLNQEDSSTALPAQKTGQGKFLVEGLREGTHRVDIDISGTLLGLPTGPVQVKGRAVGTVLVRNPNFTLTFGHPDIVREGEEYSLYVTVNNTSQADANLATLSLYPSDIYGATMLSDSDADSPLGQVKFRTIKAGDSAVAEFKFIARRTGRVTSTAFTGAEGAKGIFSLQQGVGEKGIPLSPDSLILSNYVKYLPADLLYDAMRVLGLAHSVATAPTLPAGVARIHNSVVVQRAYELTEAGLRIKLGEPLPNAIYGLVDDWSGGNTFDQAFDDLMKTTNAGSDFLAKAAAAVGGYEPTDVDSGPKVISAVQLPEADLWDRGRVVAVLLDKKIAPESANNPLNYKLLYRTDTRELRDPPKLVKVLPGRRIIEVYFECTVSPFFEYDLILSGIKGLTQKAQEPEPVTIPVVTTLTRPGGIVSGVVRGGDGSPIAKTEVFLKETFFDDEGNPYSTVTNRTITDDSGNYQIDYVTIEGTPFTISSSDPATGQTGSMSSRIIMDRQHLKLDILFLGLGTLTGQVWSADDETPVAGLVVSAGSLTTSDTFRATSDVDGRFTIKKVPVGNINLSADTKTYFGSISAGITSAGETTDVLFPVYRKEIARGSLRGRVFESDSKTPVPGVPVTISATGYGNWQFSDVEGNYSFETVPSGDVSVSTFRQETGEQAKGSGTVNTGQTATVNLVLPGTATLIGTVYNYKNEPVAGAEVLAGINLIVTDQNGNFIMEKVPLGSITVSAVVPYTSDVGTATVQVGSPGETVRVNIVLPHSSQEKGTIQGYVKDANGNPSVNQKVIIYDGQTGPTIISTDGSGFFQQDMDLGSYTVRTVNSSLTDGDMKSATLLVDGQTITLNLVLKGFGRVTGIVYQPDGVSPTVASVFITRTYYTSIGTPYFKTERFLSDQPAWDNVSGRYVIENVPLGDFRLQASNAFYSQPVVKMGKINTKGETVNLDIVLVPTSTVRGQVYLASGDKAGGGLKVNLSPAKSPARMQVITKEDGTFQFDLVPPEGFTLDVYDPLTGNYGVARGTVETGDDATMDISILGKGTVRVKVINGKGDPVANSPVQINSGSPVAYLLRDFPRILTDQNGEVVFTNIPEGNFSVTAQDPYTLTGGKSGGTIPEDLVEVSVTILVSASGDVEGLVYSPDGLATVPYAQIKLVMAGRPAFYTTSDSEGAFLFDFVPLGAFNIEVFHPGTGRGGKTSGMVDYDTEVVEADVQLNAQGTVEGFIYTASGSAVAKARVSITSNDFPGSGAIIMTSNLEGRFRVSGIPEGSYTVSAYDDTRKISGSAGGIITTEGEEVRTDVYLQATGTIYGQALAANGETPVPYAQVTLSGTRPGSFVADSEGSFLFATLPLGAYSLAAKEQSGLDTGQATATVAYEGQMNNVNIIFLGTGNIEGRVRRADGAPLTGVPIITLQRTNGGTFTAYPDMDGNFAFYGIPVGKFSISVKLPGTLLGGAYGGTLSGDGTTLKDVLILIEDSGRITGKVLRQDGTTPCKDAVITCSLSTPDHRGFTLYAISAADGSFSFNDIPLGSFTLSVYDYASGGIGKGSGSISSSADLFEIPPVILDEKAPFVTGVSPASGSVQVPLNSTVVVTFSEPVEPSSVNAYTIRVTGGPNVLQGALVLSGDRKSVTFTPSPGLPEFTSISVTVSSVRDASGQTMYGMFVATFTSADITAPTVLTAKMIKGNFVAEFSEAVSAGSGTFRVKNTTTGEIVSGVLTFSAGNKVATFYPSVPLPDNIVFELLISGFTDPFGNIQLDEFRTTYLTGDKVPPVLTLSASAGTVIEGTPVTVTATASSSDLYTVDFRVNGSLVQTSYKAPYSVVVTPSSTITVNATGSDYSGNLGPEASININVVPNTVPSVAISSPADGAIVGTGQNVTMRAQATDDLGLKEIELRTRSAYISQNQVYKVGANVKSETHDFAFTVPSNSLPGTDIRLETVSRDIRGLESPASVIVLHVEDKTPPFVQITSFTQSFHVKIGEAVPVNIFASDNGALRRIDFKTEGGLVLSDSLIIDPPSSDAVARFTLMIPANYTGGTKVTVAPFATDLAGNVGYAPRITLIADDVAVPTVEIVSPQDGSSVLSRSTVKITARASDNDAVEKVEFYVDGQLFATDKAPSNNLYEASFIVPAGDGTSIVLSAKSYDTTGNASDQASITVNVVKDTIPPVVTMASNISSIRFTEGHTISVGATATDNIGIASAQLFVNSTEVSRIDNPGGSALTFAYLVEKLIPEGMSTVKADIEVKVQDFDGNSGTTGVYKVDIARDATPSVSFPSLQSGQNVLGGAKVRIDAKGTDDYGLKSLEIKVNGISLAKGSSSTLFADYDVPETALGSSITVDAFAVDTMDQASSATISLNVPLALSRSSEITTVGEVIDLAVFVDYIYVLEKGGNLSVLDVKDPSNPTEIASLALGADYSGIDIYEGVLYAYGTGLVMLGIYDPEHGPGAPAIINTYATSAPISGIGFRSGYAYCALGPGGLLILDIHDPGNAIGILESISNLKGLKIEGDTLFAFHGSANPALSAYSMTDPLDPSRVNTYTTAPVELFDYGTVGIGVTGNNILSSFSFSGPGFTKNDDLTITRMDKVKAVDLRGKYGFVSSGADGWGMVEMAGGTLSEMGLIASGGTNKIALYDGQVYAGGAAGLKVYGLTSANPANPPDPQVQITSPLTGSSVASGAEIEVMAEVIGGEDVSVTFYVEGKELFTDDAPTYSYRFRAAPDVNTLHMKAKACNLNGVCNESAEVILNTVADPVQPTVNITSPDSGTVPVLFEGDTLSVMGSAQDNIGIRKVELLANGNLVDSTIQPAFALKFESADDGLPGTDSQIELTVRATDVSGNVVESKFNARIIQDNPPEIKSVSTMPSSEIMANSLITLSASVTDDRGVEEVKFYDGDVLLGTGTLSDSLYWISYRVPGVTGEGETRTLRAVATDMAGQSTEASITITILMDNVLPVVTMISDLAAVRFTEGHSSDLAVTAADNIGVALLELIVNSQVVSIINDPASNSLTFAYLVGSLIPQGMNSVKVPLEVRATDLNGNIGTSETYTIEVFPDNPPSVTILSPLPGQNVMGGATVRIEATAVDDFGVASMEMKANGLSLGRVSGASILVDYKVPTSAFGSSVVIEAIATDTLGKSVTGLVDVNVTMRISLLSTISTGVEIIDAAFYSGHVFTLEKNAGISVIDVSNPSWPTKVAALSFQGNFSSLRMFEGVAYIYGPDGLILIDVLDPVAPAVLEMFTTDTPVLDISFRDGYAYCAMGAGGLMILDVHEPQEIGTIPP